VCGSCRAKVVGEESERKKTTLFFCGIQRRGTNGVFEFSLANAKVGIDDKTYYYYTHTECNINVLCFMFLLLRSASKPYIYILLLLAFVPQLVQLIVISLHNTKYKIQHRMELHPLIAPILHVDWYTG